MPDIDRVMKTPRHEGFDCDDRMGPFLSALRRWHEAKVRYEASRPATPEEELEDPAEDEGFDESRISLWRYVLFGYTGL
ncbi:MAG: hypothetical protein J2P17_06190 [Mycobacterium sp.]|nr:hypothetical protein [Mycobacterium sp.]